MFLWYRDTMFYLILSFLLLLQVVFSVLNLIRLVFQKVCLLIFESSSDLLDK